MEFVTYQHPSEFRSKEKTDTVRRVVTTRQHRLARSAKESGKAEHEFVSCQDQSDARSGNSNKAARRRRPRTSGQQSVLRGHSDGTLIEAGKRLKEGKKKGLHVHAATAPTSRASTPQNAVPLQRKTQETLEHPRSETSLSPTDSAGNLSVHTEPARLPPQMTCQSLLPCESVFNALLSHIHTQVLPSHVASLHLEQSQSRVATNWSQAACASEPALFHVLCLNAVPRFACSHLQTSDLIYHLRSSVHTAIQDALASEQRRQSAALVLAVSTIAFHECAFGDPIVAQAFHRPALRKLIAAYGGLGYLPMPDVMKRMILVSELVMQARMGDALENDESVAMNGGRGENMFPLREGPQTELGMPRGLTIWMPDLGEVVLSRPRPLYIV